MLRTRSERLTLLGLGLAAAAALAQPWPVAATSRTSGAPQAPQAPAAPARPAPQATAEAPEAPAVGAAQALVSSDINVSRTDAVIRLGFRDGRQVEFAIRDGRMFADGSDLGAAPRGSAGERAWRDLLARAMDASTPQVGTLLRSWSAPAQDAPLKQAIEAALAGRTPVAPVVASAAPAPATDSLRGELERVRDSLEQARSELQTRNARENDYGSWAGPFRYIWRGLTGIIGTLVTFLILFGMGVAVVFFGARPHLEAVADTARRHTARSFIVGLAASFLALPAYILGALALVISIIGIPALLVWVPLFPVAVVVAALFGYLAVAHGTGEVLAERRLYGGDWFRRGNSYYFLLSGLGVLLALFLAAHVVEMAGPWVAFIRGLLVFLACVATWFAVTTGLGAVLLTRGGTRPTTGITLDPDVSSAFEEESRV